MSPRHWIAILAFAATAWGDVSSNTSLSGPYYFRQVLLVTDSTGSTVNTTQSAWGTLTFSGNAAGTFTINGQQMSGTSAPVALTGSGTYSVKSGGVTTLSNPLLLT